MFSLPVRGHKNDHRFRKTMVRPTIVPDRTPLQAKDGTSGHSFVDRPPVWTERLHRPAGSNPSYQAFPDVPKTTTVIPSVWRRPKTDHRFWKTMGRPTIVTGDVPARTCHNSGTGRIGRDEIPKCPRHLWAQVDFGDLAT